MGGSAIPSVSFSRSQFEIYSPKKDVKMKEKEKDKNRREDFWPPTWGAGIKPYENEIVLTSNQLELPRSSWSRAETFIGGGCYEIPT